MLVHLGPDDMAAALRSDVLHGLTDARSSCNRWFYDDAGCALFDEITCLNEYYLTRSKRGSWSTMPATSRSPRGPTPWWSSAPGLRRRPGSSSTHSPAGTLERFVPFDIAETTLRSAAATVASEYPGISIHAVVGDFEHHVGLLPAGGRRMVAFLGSTIGNLVPAKRARLLSEIAGNLEAGESLLLGCDLVKDPARLEAAYNDSAGVTAAFNLNVLAVLNRELGAGFDPDRFAHVAHCGSRQRVDRDAPHADGAQRVSTRSNSRRASPTAKAPGSRRSRLRAWARAGRCRSRARSRWLWRDRACRRR